MNLKTIIEDSKGNVLTISVDWCPIEKRVEKINYVYASKKHSGVDLTEIFGDNDYLDAFADKVDWAELAAAEVDEDYSEDVHYHNRRVETHLYCCKNK